MIFLFFYQMYRFFLNWLNMFLCRLVLVILQCMVYIFLRRGGHNFLSCMGCSRFCLHRLLQILIRFKPNISKLQKDTLRCIHFRRKIHSKSISLKQKLWFNLFIQKRYIIYQTWLQRLRMPNKIHSLINL